MPVFLFAGPRRLLPSAGRRGLLHPTLCFDRRLFERKRAALRAALGRRWAVVCDEKICFALSRPGSDLLSRVLRRSTIGAGAFHGRVRNGNGCGRPAMTTRSAKGNPPTFAASVCFREAGFFCEHVGFFCLHAVAIVDRCAADGAPNCWRRTVVVYCCLAQGVSMAAIQRASASAMVGRPVLKRVSRVRTEEMAHRIAFDEHGQ